MNVYEVVIAKARLDLPSPSLPCYAALMLPDASPPVRARLRILGAVQGVGFRPCVFRLATQLGLMGWVNNSAQGVTVEVEGDKERVKEFILRLESEKPPRSFIQSMETSWLTAAGYHEFAIRKSDAGGAKTALVLPDIATCPECLAEIFDAVVFFLRAITTSSPRAILTNSAMPVA